MISSSPKGQLLFLGGGKHQNILWPLKSYNQIREVNKIVVLLTLFILSSIHFAEKKMNNLKYGMWQLRHKIDHYVLSTALWLSNSIFFISLLAADFMLFSGGRGVGLKYKHKPTSSAFGAYDFVLCFFLQSPPRSSVICKAKDVPI